MSPPPQDATEKALWFPFPYSVSADTAVPGDRGGSLQALLAIPLHRQKSQCRGPQLSAAGTRGLGHHGFLPAAPCASKIKVISHCHPAQLSPTARAPDHSPRPGTAGPGSRCSWPQAAEKLLPLLHCLCSSFPSSKSLGQRAALGGDCHPLLPAEDQGRVQQRLKHFPSLWEWREGHPI